MNMSLPSTSLQVIFLGLLPSLAKAVETINVLVCLVQWANHENRTLPPKEHIEQLWNGPSNSDIVEGESISDYMFSNTYGKYNVNADVVDWLKVDETEEYASNGNMGNSVNGRDIEDVFVPVLAAAEASGYNLTKYANSENHLYGVAFVHSGYRAELGGTDEDGTDYLNRIISKSWGVNIGVGSVRLLTFPSLSVYKGLKGQGLTGIGVWVHEWLHSKFNLRDLYDLGGRYNDSTASTGGIGAFGVMSYYGGQGYKEEFPGIMTPFHKMALGALDPILISSDGTYTARASASFPDVYMIKGPYSPNEYLLIENRQPVLSDKNLWEEGGIVIYHVDENLSGNDVRGGPFLEGWPGNGAHYQVAVLQADGKYELEQAINLGDAGDFWGANDVLGPGNGETNATAEGTYPNSDSYVSGNIVVTGLVISNFTLVESGVWNFTVSDFSSSAPSQQPSMAPTVPIPPSPAPATPAPTLGPVRCPQYDNSLFQDKSWSCNCNSDCDKQSPTCECEEAKACCDIYSSTSAPTVATVSTSAPTVTTVSTSAPTVTTQAPSQSPSLNPSAAPVTSSPTLAPSVERVSPTVSPADVLLVAEDSSSMSGGGVFGTVLVVLLAVGAMAYVVVLQKRLTQPGGNEADRLSGVGFEDENLSSSAI